MFFLLEKQRTSFVFSIVNFSNQLLYLKAAMIGTHSFCTIASNSRKVNSRDTRWANTVSTILRRRKKHFPKQNINSNLSFLQFEHLDETEPDENHKHIHNVMNSLHTVESYQESDRIHSLDELIDHIHSQDGFPRWNNKKIRD